MNTILHNIISQKQQEVSHLKASFGLKNFQPLSPIISRTPVSLREQLLKNHSSGIIAEFKRKSPSKGWFKSPNLPASQIAGSYAEHGATGVSILTDKTFFGGSIADLQEVRRKIKIPILRKDFILDECQIQETKAYGADVVLLIASLLSPEKVFSLSREAKRIGLEVLLEIHDESEIGHICDTVDIIGVNNRDLNTFKTNIEISFRLINKISSDKVIISESGISSVQQIKELRKAGFHGFLIGENFMKEKNPAEAFIEFAKQIKEKV